MSQVIIVSNRLPISVKKVDSRLEFYPSVGGLATGLSSYVDDPENTWIGWPGIPSDDLSNREKQEIVNELAKHNCTPVWLSRRQIDEFYNGYSNAILWPLFHNIGRLLKENDKRRRWWQTYRDVNKKFAEATISLSESKGRIWIHDYQLMLVPEMLRSARDDITIGFFLHIPFPDVKTLGKLSASKKLLKGMLGADVVGFHTPGYVENFLSNCESDGLGVADAGQLILHDRVVRVSDFPMGIDYEKYARAARSRTVKKAIKKYRKLYRRRKVIVAVDRLDPSKGLVERLQAYQMFLEKYPRQHGKVIYSMVAAPSRTDVPAYQRLSKKLGALVEEINQTYGTAKWQPVDYINRSVPFEEVTALFRVADVAFIAPIRDGMNLAAKEFVASSHKHGVLILSETAGASEELRDAILVNPKRPETMVDALDQALTMRRAELKRRIGRMRETLSRDTVQVWAKNFVTSLQQPVPGTPALTRTLRPKYQQKLVNDYRAARKRLLLLDYDGSLVPFHEDYKNANPPKVLIKLLEKLCVDKANEVVIISGRSPYDLERWFSHLPISLVAEHGASVKKVGNKSWKSIEKTNTDWKELLVPVLHKYARLAPGARVETKPHSLVWHYRAASPYHAQKYVVILKRILKPVIKLHRLEILQGNKVLEIKNPKIGKGIAAESWLRKDYGFLMAIGDDMTDEILFATLPASAYSIKVGKGRTRAYYRLESYREVRSMLGKLTKV